MTEEIICKNLSELPAIANRLVKKYKENRVFAFFGGLGAGKTTFIKEICNNLGATDNITSPSFGIINIYNTTNNEIYHFDFYRIKNLNEVYDLGYEEYFYSGNYCFIEWPEKIDQLLPTDTVKVTIETNESNDHRKLIF
jgi:tRNA threonylcarbamoyladenosine biosynthesis protein TsaE